MQQDVSEHAGAAPLFRSQATRAAGRRLFGSVTVIVPPSGRLALMVGMLALTLLGFVAWTVEIPQRARAVGILMPPDGLLEIVANAAGRIANIHVGEGQAVSKGELLLNITSGWDRLASHSLQILRSEISLLDAAHARQLAIDRNHLLALDEQLASIERRLAIANEEYELQQEQVRLLERRLTRRRELARNGSLSADALDRERGLLLQARTRLAAMRHAVLGFQQDRTAISHERTTTDDESTRRELLHGLDKRRLQRQVIEQQDLIDREIRAVETGVVARVNVRPGATIRAGEVLLKIYRPHPELEAWLYLSSSKAGFLQQGQRVKLRLDAYPYQAFGTTDAIVTSISRIAIVPADLRIPLALNDPVFEIRARLDTTHVTAFDTRWPLAPGTSFKADVVQRRYKLYEWLLRSLAGRSDGKRA